MKTQRTSRIMERELLNANVAPNIYEELKEAWKQEGAEGGMETRSRITSAIN